MKNLNILISVLLCSTGAGTALIAQTNSVTFNFEASGAGGDIAYGTQQPGAGGDGVLRSPILRDGFTFDVRSDGPPNGGLHIHEVDSMTSPKVPDRPTDKRGVLWRDGVPGTDPLVITHSHGALFSLEGLTLATGFADSATARAVKVTGYRGSSVVAAVELPVTAEIYTVFQAATLGTLSGVIVDRLEFVGLALSTGAYFFLDDLVLRKVRPAGSDCVSNLTADWSDTSNPNGLWSVLEGANLLPWVRSWSPALFISPQAAWAPGEASPFLPAWFKASTPTRPSDPVDWLPGDVITHTWDAGNGGAFGHGSVVWTSPRASTVNIRGTVWMARNIGRATRWTLRLNGVIMSTGTLTSDDPFDRRHRISLTAGSGGSAALTAITVQPGDRIQLTVENVSAPGEFTGVDLSVQHTGPDCSLLPPEDVITYGGPGDQFGTAIGSFGSDLFATGNVLGGSVLLRLSAQLERIWASPRPNANYFSVAAMPGHTLALGSMNPGLCPGADDGVGDREAKIAINQVSSDGTISACRGSSAFSYRGHESIRAQVQSGSGPLPGLFTGGASENCGFGHTLFVLERRDADGNLLQRVTEPGTDFTRFDCQGLSEIHGMAESNGRIYAAGVSKLASESGSPAPMLMRYTTGLTRIWKVRRGDTAGTFFAAGTWPGVVFAAGRRGDGPTSVQLAEAFNEDGDLLWSQTYGPGELKGLVASQGRLFVGGTDGTSAPRQGVVMELDASSGALIRSVGFGGSQDEAVTGLALTGTSLYAVGSTNSFPTPEGNLPGQYDMAVWRIHAFGVPGGVNRNPVALDDTARVVSGGSVTISVLANDRDADGDPITIASVGAPSLGSISIAGPALVYTARAGTLGTDRFTYTISDGRGGTASANIVVNVSGPNRPPVANRDSVRTPKNTSIEVPVLVNDTDPDGDPLRVVWAGDTRGAVQILRETTVRYTPPANFTGTTSFYYRISDGQLSATNSVDVAVGITEGPTDGNRPPVARNDVAATQVGRSVLLNPLANDNDPDEDVIFLVSHGSPRLGTVLREGNSLTYRPNPGVEGTDLFGYEISDTRGNRATATITVTIQRSQVNRPPTVLEDTLRVALASSARLSLLANAVDPDGDPLTVTNVRKATADSVSTLTVLPGDSGVVEYRWLPVLPGTPNVDTISFTVSDGRGGTAEGRISVIAFGSRCAESPTVAWQVSGWTFSRGRATRTVKVTNTAGFKLRSPIRLLLGPGSTASGGGPGTPRVDQSTFNEPSCNGGLSAPVLTQELPLPKNYLSPGESTRFTIIVLNPDSSNFNSMSTIVKAGAGQP